MIHLLFDAVEGLGGLAYLLGGVKTYLWNSRRAGYVAAALHDKAVEVEKRKWPTSWEDIYSQRTIKARERYYRRRLPLQVGAGAALWPLQWLWMGIWSTGRLVNGTTSQAWSQGAAKYQEELRAKRFAVELEEREKKLLLEDPAFASSRRVLAIDPENETP